MNYFSPILHRLTIFCAESCSREQCRMGKHPSWQRGLVLLPRGVAGKEKQAMMATARGATTKSTPPARIHDFSYDALAVQRRRLN